jgi:predicted NAD-dependent protein-ADP-ribosyltransferase YbiA (DUF1768 family)
MVLSNINQSVSYQEIKRPDREDVDTDVDLYMTEQFDVDIIIAAGTAKHTFKDKGIVFFPLYMLTNKNTFIQIGLYELKTDDYLSKLNDENNLDIVKVNDPLIYSFVNKKMLQDNRMLLKNIQQEDDKPALEERIVEEEREKEPEKEEVIDLQEDDIEEEVDYELPCNRKDLFIITAGVAIPGLLEEETEESSKQIKAGYTDSPTDAWINNFFKNHNYSLVDNEGGGDCLFATIRDAFSSIAQQTSVNKLRTCLAKEATVGVFEEYKANYDMYSKGLIDDTKKSKELAAQHVLLKGRFTSTTDREERKKIIDIMKQVKEEHDTLITNKKVISKLFDEFKFMKGIDNQLEFQQKIRMRDFWADSWAISTLERVLNVKFIILSSDAYNNKDIANVLSCTEIDPELKKKGIFNPEFYIIVDHTGTHYKTVSYKQKMIYKFSEIPYDIKRLIVDKCMEKNAGTFSIINEFQTLKSEMKPVAEPINTNVDLASNKVLYNDDVVFLFYSKSSDVPPPGKGSGEKMEHPEQIADFIELAKIPQWRKKLSNFWIQPFVLDGHKWSSVEHYYQGSKFKINNPTFYLSFSLDSGTKLSEDPLMAKTAGGKTGKSKDELLRPKGIKIDPDFFDRRHKQEMYDAQYAKFTQNEELKRLLINTQNAKLTHHVRGGVPVVFNELMLVRDKIKHEPNNV